MGLRVKGNGLKSRLARVTLILLTLASFNVTAEVNDVAVLTHADVDTKALSSAQLRKIFSMRQTVWPDGTPISVFVLASQNPAHQALCKDILYMFPYQVERIWDKLAYSGLGEKPMELASEQQMLEMLATTPGAIGYALDDIDVTNTQRITIEAN